MGFRKLICCVTVFGLGVLAPACGGESETSSSTGGTGGKSTGGTGGKSTGGTGGTTAGGTGGATTGGAGGAAGKSGTGGTGGSVGGTGGSSGNTDIIPTIQSQQFVMDCMPIVGADPLNGSFSVMYSNAGTTSGEITITQATLHIQQSASSLDWTFSVTPPASGSIAAGSSTVVPHTKVMGSGSGGSNTPQPCDVCGGQATLEVSWDNGKTATSSPQAITCAL